MDGGDRETGVRKAGQHACFPIERMGALEQGAGRLLAQDIGLAGRDQLVGWIGLATLELL